MWTGRREAVPREALPGTGPAMGSHLERGQPYPVRALPAVFVAVVASVAVAVVFVVARRMEIPMNTQQMGQAYTTANRWLFWATALLVGTLVTAWWVPNLVTGLCALASFTAGVGAAVRYTLLLQLLRRRQ